MTSRLAPLITNMEGTTMVINRNHFLWNGILHDLPGNLVDAPPSLTAWFNRSLQMRDKVFYTWNVPKDKLDEFLKKRMMERLKNCPENPVIKGIFVVAQATTFVFVLVIGFKTIARL